MTDSVNLKDLPPGIRHYQSFRFNNFKNSILSYLKPSDDVKPSDEVQSPPINTGNTGGIGDTGDTGSGDKRGRITAVVLASVLLLVVSSYYIFSHNSSQAGNKIDEARQTVNKGVFFDMEGRIGTQNAIIHIEGDTGHYIINDDAARRKLVLQKQTNNELRFLIYSSDRAIGHLEGTYEGDEFKGQFKKDLKDKYGLPFIFKKRK